MNLVFHVNLDTSIFTTKKMKVRIHQTGTNIGDSLVRDSSLSRPLVEIGLAVIKYTLNYTQS